MESSKKKNLIVTIIIFILITLLFGYFGVRSIYEKTIFFLNGNKNIKINIYNKYEEPGYVALINGKNISDKVKIISNVNTNKIGTYEVKYLLEYKFLNIKKVLKRDVKVVDLEKPILKINSDDEIYLFTNEDYQIPGYEAIDNLDGNITDKVIVNSNLNTKEAGTYEIEFKVTDSNNNESIKKITIYVDSKHKNSYIEVYISKQVLYYYEKNKLVLSSNIVTGMNNVSPTPIGNYKVISKSRNVKLIGTDYENFVSYWIAFIGRSYGFHDASWRNNFGGNIYTYNGSHGCINMPKNKASSLYYLVDIGTPVYIKY